MAKKEFSFRGKTLEELQQLSIKDLAPLLTASARRKINRGFTDAEKIFLRNIESSKSVKTHCRDMYIFPNMVGKTIKLHSGKSFDDIIVQPEMIGHRLGEFVMSRKRVKHSVGGVAKGGPKRK